MGRPQGQMQNTGFGSRGHRGAQVVPRGRCWRGIGRSDSGCIQVLTGGRSGVHMRRQMPHPPQAAQLVNVVVVMKRQVQRGQSV